MSPLLLVAHGSADPRAAAANRALARAVRARHRGPVRVAFLDHAGPRPDAAVRALAAEGWSGVTVVPLLLTAAYHARVDLPAVLDRVGAGLDIRVADVLGPVGGLVPAGLLGALRRRLVFPFDAVVLAAAGTRDRAALSTVEHAARALGARLGVPCRPAYASASAPTGGEAVRALRAAGARRVAVASYFLAPGRLYDAVATSARDAGAVAVAEPLGDAPDLARVVLARAAAARPRMAAVAA